MPARTVFDHPPGNWKELEALVAQLFREMGCEAQTSHSVVLPRGSVALDVYVNDRVLSPPAVYVLECKHWSRPVPKAVVHAFRTVLTECGAHRGFIISTLGFQSGARDAAKHTNVDLLSWSELQALFFDRWLLSSTHTYHERVRNLRRLMAFPEDEDLSDNELWEGRECSEEAFSELVAMRERYAPLLAWSVVTMGALSIEKYLELGFKIGLRNAPAKFTTYRTLVNWFPVLCGQAERRLEKFLRLRTDRPHFGVNGQV